MISGDETSKTVLEKWFQWLYQHMTVTDTYYSVPTMISWSGSLPTNTKLTILEEGSRVIKSQHNLKIQSLSHIPVFWNSQLDSQSPNLLRS